MSDDPTFVPHLSPAQIQRIRTSPAHRRLKHLVYSQLALAVTGATVNLVCIILGAVWARGVLKEEKWLIFHYTLAALLSVMWAGYSYMFLTDVRNCEMPLQLQVDIGWIMMAALFASSFLAYIFFKLAHYATLELFEKACSVACEGKMAFVRIAPGVLTLLTPLLFALPQLLLLLLLYRTPIVNPPLDSHGLPLPQDPETGAVLPLDARGKPVWPEWLRGAMEPTVKGGDGARRTEVGGSEGDSASEEEEKGLLGPDEKSSAGPHELGKRLSEARRSAGRRVRR
ncbi:hypothetical protein OF846_001427 [Rhodotorula toruloides]|nr:hypothetical protein OF846_001427 [Rhodotorula toruloides]